MACAGTRSRRDWQPFSTRQKPRGRSVSQVRVNAAHHSRLLAETELDTAYVRGFAHALLDRGESHAVVYRAGSAGEPRRECSSWEGSLVPLATVIAGHRARYWPPPGDATSWSIPPGPGCHHSICAPDLAAASGRE